MSLSGIFNPMVREYFKKHGGGSGGDSGGGVLLHNDLSAYEWQAQPSIPMDERTLYKFFDEVPSPEEINGTLWFFLGSDYSCTLQIGEVAEMAGAWAVVDPNGVAIVMGMPNETAASMGLPEGGLYISSELFAPIVSTEIYVIKP